MHNRYLVLNDGSVWEGKGFGGHNYQVGEIVSHSAMSGYQEIISDSCYDQQIVIMNFPLIGAVGINHEDFESITPSLFGLVIKELCEEGSNFRNEMSLPSFLESKDIPGICDIDTRALFKHLQHNNISAACMCDTRDEIEACVKLLSNYKKDGKGINRNSTLKPFPIPHRGKRVVIVDLGARFSFLRTFSEYGYDLMVVPYDMSAEDIMSLHPEVVVYSHGCGSVDDLDVTLMQLKKLINKYPIFCEGLGSLLLAKANQANITVDNVFTHSSSMPIRSCLDHTCSFVASHHEYEIERSSLEKNDCIITHEYIFNQSVAAFKHKSLPLVGICYLVDGSFSDNIAMNVVKSFLSESGGNNNE